MNANSKKLLSLLVVVAMVVAMVPAISLQADAAEEGYAFSGSPATVHCDGCNADVALADWTAITSVQDITTAGHYYFNAAIANASTNKIDVNTTGKVCLHLNGYSFANSSQGGAYYAVNCLGGTLNLMGEGLIQSKTKATTTSHTGGAVVATAGTVNIYGGAYKNYNANSPATIAVSTRGGNINIYGGEVTGLLSVGTGTLTVSGGTFTSDPSAYVAEGYEATAGDGTWTVAEKATAPTVNLPTTCPGCGETVTEWIPVTTATGTSDWANGSGHFYLANDLSGSGKRVMQFPADIEVCLHLNGHSITSTCTQASAITVRSYSTLRIMGEGTISSGENTAAMGAVVSYGGTVEIYGGTYYSNTENNCVRVSGGAVEIYGGTYSEQPSNAFVQDGYEATENQDGTWTVAEKVATPLPTTCPMCGDENVTWTEVTAATGDAGFAASGHYALANDIVGTAKRAFRIPADQEICLHLNGCDITTTSNTPGPIALQSYGTLRVMGEGEVSSQGTTAQWAPIVADAGGTVEIYGGTYVTNVEGRKALTMQEDEGNTMIVYGGSFSSDPSKYLNDGLWALPAGEIWTVGDITAAAIIKADSYKTYATAAEAVADYTEGYILIGNADSIVLTKDAYVDNRGNAVTVTGSGKLYAMDSVGNGAWTVAADNVVRDVVNPVTEKRFLTVGGESYEIELKLTQVVLRAGKTSDNMGLYYKASIKANEELAGLIEAYGTVFSLVDAPDAGFLYDTDSRYTMVDCEKTPLAGGETVVNSGAVFGIMDENTPDKNAEYGEMGIFANAYIALDLDGDGAEEYIMGSNGTSRSLKSVMVAFNGMEEIPAAVKEFYGYWAQYGMNAWAPELDKIAA